MTQRAPEGPSTEDPSTQESRPDHGTTEATIKIKRFPREEMENTYFWQRLLTARQLLHGAKARKTANTHPESTLGGSSLVGPWALAE